MEHAHIVGRFDKDLAKIKERIVEMGELVGDQLSKATLALSSPDAAEIDKLVATDRRVNGMNKTIATRSERLIALRQPMALDLREALIPINIAGELERIGDHAKSTAKRARKMPAGGVQPEPLAMLENMNRIVQEQLRDVLQAYSSSDIELAGKVRQRDKDVDALNKAVFAHVVDALSQAGPDAEAQMNVVLIARNFERIGDHIVNVARQVNQIVTGDDLKATD